MIGAFDLGTTTGWACGAAKGALILSGTWYLKGSRFEGGGMRGVNFEDRLRALHKANKFTRIYYELVRSHKGTDAAHIYGGLLMVLTSFCERENIPYAGETVQAIKQHAAGKGNASKEMVIEAVKSWGYKPVDDNEADAIALLSLKLEEIG